MRNILITGVSSGIGEYIAKNLKAKNNLFGISRKDISSDLKDINFSKVDISDFNALKSYLDSIKGIEFDAVILNAGVGYFDKAQDLTEEEVISTINTNLTSNIILTNKLLDSLPKKAKIIFIGSIAGKKFFNYGAVYQASKFGLRGFAGSIRNEITQKVFLLNPNFVDTNFFINERLEIKVKGGYKETKIEDILKAVEDILEGKETRFEIDF